MDGGQGAVKKDMQSAAIDKEMNKEGDLSVVGIIQCPEESILCLE